MIKAEPEAARQQLIINSFTDNYADLMASDPSAWRGKFRKMAESPFAFYRGSAALFYAWDDINDLDDVLQVTEQLGRCVAKIHCCSDDDSDQTLVTFSTEEAINGVIARRETEFVNYLVDFGESYGAIVRNDHRLFVDAFRNRQIPGI
jgi:uncharacterized protein (DUF2252 family)